MCLVWGLTWLPVKVAAASLPPVTIAAVRFVLASAVFGLIVLLRRTPLGTTRTPRLIVAGTLMTTFSYGLNFWGVAHAPTGLSAIVNMALIPVASMAIGWLYGEETISPARIAAIVVGAAGLVLLFWTSLATAGIEGPAVGRGLGAIALGTVLYAWGAVLSRPLTREMPALAIAFWQTVIGAVALVGVAGATGGLDAQTVPTILADPVLVASFAFLVLGGSIVGFSAYMWLLAEWGPFRAGLYSFVSPAIAVAVGVAVLGERFGWQEAAGTLAMFAATALVIRRRA